MFLRKHYKGENQMDIGIHDVLQIEENNYEEFLEKCEDLFQKGYQFINGQAIFQKSPEPEVIE